MSQIDLAKWLEWLDQTAKMFAEFAEAYEPEETYTEDEVRQWQAEAWEEGWQVGYRRGAGVPHNDATDRNPYTEEDE